MANNKTSQLHIRINDELLNDFKIYCKNYNTTMSEIILADIKQIIDRNSIVLFKNKQYSLIKNIDYNLRRVGNNFNQAVASLNSLVKYLEQGFDDRHTARVLDSLDKSIKEVTDLYNETNQILLKLA